LHNRAEERVVELQLKNESLQKALESCKKELAQSASKLGSGYTNAQLEIGMLKGTIHALQHELTQVHLDSDTYSECIKSNNVRICEMRDVLATVLEEKGELRAAVQQLMVENTKVRAHLYSLADGGGNTSSSNGRAYYTTGDAGDKNSDQQKKDDEQRYTSTIAELEGEVAMLLGKVKEADQFKAYFKSFKIDVEQLVQVAEHAKQHAHQELAAIRQQLKEEQAACSKAQKQCAAAADDAEQYQKVAGTRLLEMQNAIEAAVEAKKKATNAGAALRMTKAKVKQVDERRREADLHATALQQQLADIELSYLETRSELEETLQREEDAKLQNVNLTCSNSGSNTRVGISMKAELEHSQATATRLAQHCRQLEEKLGRYGDAPESNGPSFFSSPSFDTQSAIENDPRIANLKAVITNIEMQLADARSANMKLERELVTMELRLKHRTKAASPKNNSDADTKMKIGRLLRAVEARDAVIDTLRMKLRENTDKDVDVLLGSLSLYNDDNDEWKGHVHQMIKMWRRCVETKNEEIRGLRGEMEAMKGELDQLKVRCGGEKV
jgi:chromosome segregation ATPase